MITGGLSASRVCVETGGSDLRKSARSTVISSLLSFIAQCLGDRRKQRLRVERFAKEPAYSLSPRLISNLMATRDQENRQLSMRLPDDLAEFEAADPGHANIGDKQVHVRKADRKSTRLNSSHYCATRMQSSACHKNHITQH